MVKLSHILTNEHTRASLVTGARAEVGRGVGRRVQGGDPCLGPAYLPRDASVVPGMAAEVCAVEFQLFFQLLVQFLR